MASLPPGSNPIFTIDINGETETVYWIENTEGIYGPYIVSVYLFNPVTGSSTLLGSDGIDPVQGGAWIEANGNTSPIGIPDGTDLLTSASLGGGTVANPPNTSVSNPIYNTGLFDIDLTWSDTVNNAQGIFQFSYADLFSTNGQQLAEVSADIGVAAFGIPSGGVTISTSAGFRLFQNASGSLLTLVSRG